MDILAVASPTNKMDKERFQHVRTITSIDPATKNIGIVKFDVKENKILRMAHVNLSSDSTKKKKTSARQVYERFLEYSNHETDIFDSDMIIVEQQMYNPRRPSQILSNMRNMCLESCIVSKWHNKSFSVSPASTRIRFKTLYTRYRKKKLKGKYAQNKHDSVQLGRRLMTAQERLVLSQISQSIPKVDDILEAFLQVLKVAEDITGKPIVDDRLYDKIL